MTKSVSSHEAAAIFAASLQFARQPWGPRGDRYVWAGRSCRRNGFAQERVGTRYNYALMSVDGRHLGRVSVKAWASPLACPLR